MNHRHSPLVIAHRGASGYRPEHSRAAYDLALTMGVDAIEPDIVATRDGVLVLRHENEISGTTDVALRPEFAHRRATKTIDGQKVSGWFTEDFTWRELSTLRVKERLRRIRPANRAFDGEQGILRLADLIELLGDGPVGMVAEIKHATYFESIGLPLDELLVAELEAAGWLDDPRLTIEAFETTVLEKTRARGVRAPLVFLVEASGSPADQLAAGTRVLPFSHYVTDEGLAQLAASGVDGVSVNKSLLLRTDAAGRAIGTTDLVERAHGQGMRVFCWTLRAENHFLARNFRLGVSPGAMGDWQSEFGLIMASGVDGVFADHPDLALAARAALP